MKLAVSNIAWNEQDDGTVLKRMSALGFSGLEVAPPRLFPEGHLDKLREAKEFGRCLRETSNLEICSMQSIWFGITERLFGSREERSFLEHYTKRTILFAEALQCRNIVFGSPKNRILSDASQRSLAIDFFREVGGFASTRDSVIAIEANPTIYGTNFLNTTREAVDFVQEVASPGVKINLDTGTIIANGEDVAEIAVFLHTIHHVHISEPYLEPVRTRGNHAQLAGILTESGFNGYVSIEMKRQDSLGPLFDVMTYIAEVFS